MKNQETKIDVAMYETLYLNKDYTDKNINKVGAEICQKLSDFSFNEL